jgi:8-oxo-dGTP diphosphatase
MHKVVNVAAAVLMREDGKVLLASRPEGKGWAGWWEFPGGKIESNETPLQALVREIEEEIGVQVIEAYPWLTRTFDYPEKTVKLHFFIVRAWKDLPVGREGQVLSWQNPQMVTVSPTLPANTPVLDALKLPEVYAITNLHELGEVVFFERLVAQLKAGLRLIQIREKELSEIQLADFTSRVMKLAAAYQAKVLVNASVEQVKVMQVDGVHLTSQRLMELTEKPQSMIVGASCHGLAELMQAAKLELDFVVLSPVMRSKTHPETAGMGWSSFASLIRDYPLPVYALGGMRFGYLKQAWTHGAHGIAMMRDVWN